MSFVQIDFARTPTFPLLPSTENDRYFDYCLEPYRPRRPWHGKLRGENLFWHSLQVGGCRDALSPPLRALQASLGPDMTVWGVKHDGKALFWELYFYDPQKEDKAARIESISATLAPWWRFAPSIAESVPYMMASFDFSASVEQTKRIDEWNLYLTGERHHAGRSYKARADRVELENTYRFFEAKRESEQVLALLQSSMFIDYTAPAVLSKVLIPELFACKKICVAKKRTCDAIYYSGISIEQLVWFLKKFSYPPELLAFVEHHQERFEHLFFDVGLDYMMDASGEIVYPKTSYYGTL